MARIPLIVGFGGINTAGRSSFHHGYRRLIMDSLGQADASKTYQSLAAVMGLSTNGGLSQEQQQYILEHTLIRQIENEAFDVNAVRWNKLIPAQTDDKAAASFITKQRNIPEIIPASWTITDLGNKEVRVDISGDTDFLLPTTRTATVQAAGQLPSGFQPGKLYPSRSHPRGLEMAIYGASDALMSTGMSWDVITNTVSPDQISVYAGSAMGQLDTNGSGGMLGGRFNDKRTTSKQLPFGLAEMAADFINAYVLGSMGNTGTYVGACASFLYNLRQGVADIQSGAARVVMVGNSEAPIVSDVIDGYNAMGALATDQALRDLDGIDTPNYRRASRPFSNNCGFTIAESSQYILLVDDELAMELGTTVYGGVTDVFVNADGYKKSISSPGVGNYITVAKAAGAARSLVGEEAIRHRSFVQAHGTSTPQNRVTESHILNETAKAFGIEKWPVAAIKAYVGHSLGVSAGDQLMTTLGVWEHGVIPGIKTIDDIAEDVFDSNLSFNSDHVEVGKDGIDVAILNAKGFGGNNASANVIAPHIVEKMLTKRYGAQAYKNYQTRNESVREQANAYDGAALNNEAKPIYKFDHNVLNGNDIDFSSSKISVPGYEESINLNIESPYSDLL